MGLGLEFTVRVRSKAAVEPLLKACEKAARARRWKVRKSPSRPYRLELLPHRLCEPVVLDFASSLSAGGFVKTSAAPPTVHVRVVEFLDAVRAHGATVRVDDETGYWKDRDLPALKQSLREFRELIDGTPAPARSVEFILGGTMVTSDGGVKHLPGTRIIVK